MENKQTLVEHLEEFRGRIIKSTVFMIIISGLFYNLTDIVLLNVVKPLGGTVVFIAPTEAFISKIKIAIFGGLFLSSPFIIYQFWQFISQGLKPSEKKYALIFGPLSLLFFVSGATFAYFIIVPTGIRFLMGFSTDFIIPMITVSKYISFVGTLVLAFGLVFQLPSLLLFLTKVGIVTRSFYAPRDGMR